MSFDNKLQYSFYEKQKVPIFFLVSYKKQKVPIFTQVSYKKQKVPIFTLVSYKNKSSYKKCSNTVFTWYNYPRLSSVPIFTRSYIHPVPIFTLALKPKVILSVKHYRITGHT